MPHLWHQSQRFCFHWAFSIPLLCFLWVRKSFWIVFIYLFIPFYSFALFLCIKLLWNHLWKITTILYKYKKDWLFRKNNSHGKLYNTHLIVKKDRNKTLFEALKYAENKMKTSVCRQWSQIISHLLCFGSS